MGQLNNSANIDIGVKSMKRVLLLIIKTGEPGRIKGVERAMLLPPSQTQTAVDSGPTATSTATIFASCPATVF